MLENTESTKALEILKSLENEDSSIFLPFDVFFANPNEVLTLNIKNNAPLTNPPIRITKVLCEWNYVDTLGNPKRTATSEPTPNTLPGATAVVQAEKGECVRTFSFQVTVGIPELGQYVTLDRVNIPDLKGCYIRVNAGVGTAGFTNEIPAELTDKLFADFVLPEPELFASCNIFVYNELPSAWNAYIFGTCGFIFDDGTDETDSQPNAKVYSGDSLKFTTKQTSKCVKKYLIRLFVQIAGEPQPRGPIDKLTDDKLPADQCVASGEFRLSPQQNVALFELQVAGSSAIFSLARVI